MKEMTISTTTAQVEKIQDAPVENDIISIVSEREGFRSNYLTSIIKNKNRIIRKLPKSEITDLYLLQEVKKIAAAYGGDNDLSPTIQRECVKALHGEFASLSVSEVWIAFRTHAAGEMDDTSTARGEMYGGKMTAKSFISVLASWKRYKAKAVAAYIKAVDEKRTEEEEAIRSSRMKMEFWPSLAEHILKLRQSECDWRDCPSYIFDSLRSRGLVPGLKENWREIWEDAAELAAHEYRNEKEIAFSKRGQIRLIGELAKCQDVERIEEKRKVVAKKIALFRLVVKNSQFDLNVITNQLSL